MAASLPLLLPMLAGDEPRGTPAGTQQPPKPQPEQSADPTKKPLPPLPESLQQELRDTIPLNPEGTVFLDRAEKRVLLRTEVACPDCILEMVLVPEGNREHETILRIRAKAFVIHSALLAAGLDLEVRPCFLRNSVA
ncbi:MAG UNVERIFIED_CONTAM: hypothetical protein LVR18_26930 [Planctomycetaceae bacterium]|jgi:hypothetical protein